FLLLGGIPYLICFTLIYVCICECGHCFVAGKPGVCPKDRVICETKDRQCLDDNKKCCVFSCGKKCLDLNQDIILNLSHLEELQPFYPHPGNVQI
uniref:WAP four-disulfide core domain 8 n=1 Tax=Canis lupus dingo TaxID=286419 RepID=A0A8C0KM88_CANLU